ncbi:MAG: hypothetical protein JXR03_16525 [Cyclobacteriaceae bacterium]
MKWQLICSLFILFVSAVSCEQPENSSIDLSGEWYVKLDPKNVGIQQEWYEQHGTNTIQLPGCLQEQGYGEQPGPKTEWWAPLDLTKRHPSLSKYAKADTNFKLVQFLMPKNHYIGAAWYSKEIDIPNSFKDRNIILNLERAHWESRLWVDGILIGKNESLATPHTYDLSAFEPGKHKLSIRIDNSGIYSLGNMAHSVSDQTQGTWNGIVGEISLSALPKLHIKSVKAYPDIHTKSVQLKMEVANGEKVSGEYLIAVDAKGYNNGNTHDPEVKSNMVKLDGSEIQNLSITYDLGEDVQLWDEFDPNLYKVELKLLTSAEEPLHLTSISFGMREIRAIGSHFYVNGVKTFMRGNVDCAVNPKTGYAPMSVDRWKEIFQVYKDFGLNHARFHSWTPPNQAFTAADEMGIYLSPEVHEWGWVKKGPLFDYLKGESREILNHFTNHPSFVMMGLGNESGIADDASAELIKLWKSMDTTRLYMVKASHAPNQGTPSEMDFEVLGHIKGGGYKEGRERTRYQAFWPPLPENSDLCAKAPQTSIDWSGPIEGYVEMHGAKPLLAHETAQFCGYPDIFNEMKKYTGYLRPTYLEIAAEQLEARGMMNQLQDYVKNSGKWQVQLTKEETEAIMRTPNYAGFQWLALNDFTGQNTAPVGFTDAFYEPKSYVSAEEMRRFCSPTTLMARLPKRVYTSDEVFECTAELFHFGKEQLALNDFTIEVYNDQGEVLISEKMKSGVFDQGNAQQLGAFEMDLSNLPAPAKYVIKLISKEHQLENNYDFWVYPKSDMTPFSDDILVVNNWGRSAYDALNAGKTVLLLPEIGTLKGNLPSCFTTFYWTSFGEKGGQSSANGIMMDNEHPLFRDFPTETHANWQWWELLTQCQPMILDQFEEQAPWPKSYKPLIQPIDSWKLNRKLGLVLEAQVLKGKLMICSMDIQNNLQNRPVARQFRKSLIDYMNSRDFDPSMEVKVGVVSALFDQSQPIIKESLQGLPIEG